MTGRELAQGGSMTTQRINAQEATRYLEARYRHVFDNLRSSPRWTSVDARAVRAILTELRRLNTHKGNLA